MLVSKKPRGPNAKPHRPNTSPNVSQWNIVRIGNMRVGYALAMYIPCCLCQFRSRWVANANAISSGIHRQNRPRGHEAVVIHPLGV